MPKPITVPQLAVAWAKVITAPLVALTGVTPGSVPDEAELAGHAEKTIVSPEPTPAPVALADMTTVVPVTESTVVAAGMTDGAVVSLTVMPATIQAGVAAKWSVALPEAVVALVAAEPETWTRA